MDGSSTSSTRGFITRAREISSSRLSPPDRTRAGCPRRFARRSYFWKMRSAASFAASATPRRTGASGRSQVGVEDALVLLHLFRRSLGEQLAVREAVDVLGELHDHAHVVLDDEQRDAELPVRLPEPLQQAVDERRV